MSWFWMNRPTAFVVRGLSDLGLWSWNNRSWNNLSWNNGLEQPELEQWAGATGAGQTAAGRFGGGRLVLIVIRQHGHAIGCTYYRDREVR